MPGIKTVEIPDNYLSGFEPFIEERGSVEPAWLKELRQSAFNRFRELGFPTIRHEDWKYTNASHIVDKNFERSTGLAPVSKKDAEKFAFPGLECHTLVFVNGYYSEELSSVGDLPKGAKVTTVSKALEEDPELLRRQYGQYSDYQNNVFVAQNIAFSTDGVFIHLPRGVVVEQPIHLLFISTAGEKATAGYTHNLVVAEEVSQASIIENYVSIGEGTTLTNVTAEVVLDKGANLDWYTLQREALTAYHVGELATYQKGDSTFRAHAFTFGGALTRNDVLAKLDGENAEGIINGLTLLSGTQHADNWMWVEHMKENIPSHELFKNVLADSASAAFTGRIYVHREAQKTDAKQTAQSLLLSPDARSHSRPQLEIYADDVKCTHGSTTGQLDKPSLFYLRSRGLPEREAKNLLVKAFAADLTERIRIPEVQDAVNQELWERLDKN